MKNFFTVYSLRLAGYLMYNGFPLVRMATNPKTGKIDFLFVNNKRLQDYIDLWQIERLNSKTEKE